MGNQHTEISTPFLHFRQFLFMHTTIPFYGLLKTINSVFFFFSFFFGRYVFQLRLTYVWFTYIWGLGLQEGAFQKFMLVFCAICQISIIGLNTYWLQLIVKQVIRLMTGQKGKDIQEEVQEKEAIKRKKGQDQKKKDQ
jgi:TLC domain